MSKVVIHQPEYLPWINLFIKMSLCEKFVFLDNVQYARRSFQNRNIINANNQLSYITVPIEYSDRDTLINEIKIDLNKKWKEDHLNKFRNSYKETKHYKKVINLVEEIFSNNYSYLSELNQDLTKLIAKRLDINCNFYLSSKINAEGKKSAIILDICKKFNTSNYITGVGSKSYLEENDFKKNNIKISYIEPTNITYHQTNTKKFISNLSIIDYLFNVGFKPLQINLN